MDQRHAYADIIVDLSAKAADKIYQYKIPKEIADSMCVGALVLVPFSNRMSLGYVIDTSNTARRSKLLEIAEVIDKEPQFKKESLDLCKWISDYYQCSLSDCLRLMLPPGGSHKIRKLFELNRSAADDNFSRVFTDIKFPATKSAIVTRLGIDIFKRELKNGSIKAIYRHQRPRVTVKKKKVISLVESTDYGDIRFGSKQIELLEILRLKGEIDEKSLLEESGASKSSLNGLVDKGNI